MKAVLLDEAGASPRVGEAPVPEPGAGEIRVRLVASGINPVDGSLANGSNPHWQWPHVLGVDGAGIVDAVGDGVNDFEPGQRVVFHGDLRREGTFAEYVVTAADVVAHIPDSVTFTQAAALPCAGMAAYQALHRRLGIRAGQTILITGGAGAVGGFAIQLAKLAGARVIATCSPNSAETVRAAGADVVVDYHGDVPAAVRDATDGRGVDAVIDTVNEQSATQNLSLLVFGGGLVAVAARPDLSAIAPFTTAPSVHEIALGAAHSHGDAAARRDLAVMLEELLALVADGKLDPQVRRVIAFDDVPEMLADADARHGRGKTILAVASE